MTKNLPGKDFSGLLSAPEKAGPNAVREGALYAYNMFAYIDGDFMAKAMALFELNDVELYDLARAATIAAIVWSGTPNATMTIARSSTPDTANSGANAAPRLRVHTPRLSTLFWFRGSPRASTYEPAVTTV